MVVALWSACAVLLMAQAWAGSIDETNSRIGFTLKTRWGQTLEGRFPVYRGDIDALPDGRSRVSLTMSARDVKIVDSSTYTRLTRGRGFFDAERHPEVIFVSSPYSDELTRSGGVLTGMLSLRGVQQREAFTIEPSSCLRPGVDCDIVASGSVQRSDYGISRWGSALSDDVRFLLRIRARHPGP